MNLIWRINSTVPKWQCTAILHLCRLLHQNRSSFFQTDNERERKKTLAVNFFPEKEREKN